MRRAAAVVHEGDAAGEVAVEDVDRVLALDPAVVDPVREADEIARKAIAADVRALPDGLLLELLRERFEQRAAVARAARVVLAVGADEKERLLQPRSRGRQVEPAQVVVGLEGRAAQLLLALARGRGVRPQLAAAAPIGSADEDETRVLARMQLPAQRVLGLVGEPARTKRVRAPQAAVLDEEPVVDPARGRSERLVVLPRDVGTEAREARRAPGSATQVGRPA
jgi:hypothetical protein